jgi:hypothetical protein
VKGADIVKQIDVVAFEEQNIRFRKAAARARAIDIATHCVDRSNLSERFEDVVVSDVA